MNRFCCFLFLFFIISLCHSQRRTRNGKSKQVQSIQNLNEVVVNSNRLETPFSKNSRSIIIITQEQIQNNAATEIASILQQYAGIDVRRRGPRGVQADLYIRGGSFEQTLLLIDGIKVDDPQTGHHTLNFSLPLEVIERIEIIKGPAARIYGQKAFNGAINIITKKTLEKKLIGTFQSGNTETGNGMLVGTQFRSNITTGFEFNNTKNIAHLSYNTSEGYRENTDFTNLNAYVKSNLSLKSITHSTIDIVSFFSDRRFGANGFYASPNFTKQYEETQASLIAISAKTNLKKFALNQSLYWRRGQDMYLFDRYNPSIYRNLHITNKIGYQANGTLTSKYGTTGIGIDVAKVTIASNNLGNRERVEGTLFLEHKLEFFDDKLTITPGIAESYYSDLGAFFFPGIDIGYALFENTRIYTNIGQTHRIPTYTDLFYTSPSNEGNENLKPESATTLEGGVHYFLSNLIFSGAVFQRNSNNLIDYVKNEDSVDSEGNPVPNPWKAQNINQLNTFGAEFNGRYFFNYKRTKNNINLAYTFLQEDLSAERFKYSRYSLNSLIHHLTANWEVKNLFKNTVINIIYKFGERPDNTSFNVVDFSFNWTLQENIDVVFQANNIFGLKYKENLTSVPEKDVLLGIRMAL